jgi:hypothetical protein
MGRSLPVMTTCLAVAGVVSAATAHKEFRRTVPVAANARVQLGSERGTARIMPWDRQEVEVLATIDARPESPDPEESVRRTEIRFDATPDSVHIRTDFGERMPNGGWFNDREVAPLVRYEIKVPRTLDLTVDDSRSEIQIGDLRGRLRLHTDRSTIEVASLEGGVSVEADRGSVRIGRLALLDGGDFNTDRTEVELGISPNHGLTLDLELDRVSPDVDDGLLTGLMREDSRHLTYRGAIGRGGPTLRYNADRGSLRLRRV